MEGDMDGKGGRKYRVWEEGDRHTSQDPYSYPQRPRSGYQSYSPDPRNLHTVSPSPPSSTPTISLSSLNTNLPFTSS